MDKERKEFLENYRNNLTLRHDQSYQLDYLVKQEIKRLERIIAERIAYGKTKNKTFENSLAFNKRLLKAINHQFYKD